MIEAISVNPVSLARELDLPSEQALATFELLEGGYPVPFIARYRKDQTNNLDEASVAKVAAAYQKQRQLTDRKLSFLKTIEAQGKLTPELDKQIREARTARRLDDVYLPFRAKRATLAQAAREKGLEPLATAVLNAADETQDLDNLAAAYVSADKGVATIEDALQGAADIIAETFSETFALRRIVREAIQRGKLVSKKVEKEAAAEAQVEAAAEAPAEQPAAEQVEAPAEEQAAEKTPDKKKKNYKEQRQEQLEKAYSEYYDASFPIHNCPAHRVLALNRAENMKLVEVTIEVDSDGLRKAARELLVPETRPYSAFLDECVDVCLTRLALPALEAEARREMTERAEEQTASVFAKNLRNLLMQRPLEGRRVLAIDPGFKNGGKVVALDENGAVLAYEAVFMQGPAERRAAAAAKLAELIETHNISVIAIGTGSGRRDAENFVSKLIEEKFADKDVAYIVVSDAGASAYASSQAAQEELPELDPPFRAAVSIGRRLQDPLKELVKIDAERLGVGSTQHDVRSKTLKETLTNVLVSCVNCVGVDLNTATPAALRYVAGLNPLTAKRVYDYRVEKGGFQSREQLKEVSGLGEVAFTQCSGFLKVVGGTNPLDATWIHPESYELASKLLEKLGFSLEDFGDAAKKDAIDAAVKAADSAALAKELEAGPYAVAFILDQFVNRGTDARYSCPGPIFKKGSMKLEDLKPGMELKGVVLNVVDFGAFVDVGVHESGLVHISQLGNSYVRDANQRVAVGDVLTVWVLDVDVQRRRVSLTTLPPGTPVQRRSEGGRRPRRENAEGEQQPREKRERRPRRNEENAVGEQQPRERRPRRNEENGEGEQSRERRPRREGRNREDRAPRSAAVAPKAKKIAPLSEDMKNGKAPLRSFSDLAQLFGRVQANEDDKKETKKDK